jgi:type IV fimbrial biogenesis protein FimT
MIAARQGARPRQAGFTLPELMIVIVIVGVMLGLGVPAYRDTIARTRITSKMNELVGAMQVARAESVRRGVDVSLCAVETGSACGETTNGTWNIGWAIIVENPAGTQGKQDAGEEVVNRNDVETMRLTFEELDGDAAAAPKSITFRPSGSIRGAGFTLVLCSGTDHGGWIVVDATGRARAATLYGSDLEDQCG